MLDIRELGRRAGSLREVERIVPAPDGLDDGTLGVPADSPLRLALHLQSVTEGVLVTGTVTADLAGECGRCLDPIHSSAEVQLVELFAYPDSTTDATADAEEASRIVDDLIDVEAVVRDAVILGLPAALCRPDCAGLCPDCGQRWDDLPDTHTHETTDPRWAALGSVREKLAEHPG